LDSAFLGLSEQELCRRAPLIKLFYSMNLQNHSRGNQDPKAKKSARFGIPVAKSTQPAEFRGFKIGQRLSLAAGLRGTGISLWIFDFCRHL
jgi:hypothetical protein